MCGAGPPGASSSIGPHVTRRGRTPSGSGPELLADQAADLAAVRPALGLAHHEAEDRAHRLVVAAADLLRGALVRGDRGRHDAGELVAALHRREALSLGDR